MKVNQILREQLDQSNRENAKLEESVRKFKQDLGEALEEADRLREEKLQMSGLVASDENKMTDLWKRGGFLFVFD